MLMSERVEQAFRPAVKLLERYRLQPLRYGLTFFHQPEEITAMAKADFCHSVTAVLKRPAPPSARRMNYGTSAIADPL